MTNKTHFIITAEGHKGRPVRIDHYGNHDKRFLIGLYGLDAPDVKSFTIRVAGTPLVYSRINAVAV